MGRNTKTIYNETFYWLSGILNSKEFLSQIRELKNSFRRFGCQLPAKGFYKSMRRDRAFAAWHKKLQNAWTEAVKSDAYRNARAKVIGKKQNWSRKEQDRLDKIDQKFLPPINYGDKLNQILLKFDLDPANRSHKDWIRNYLFFGERNFTRPSYKLRVVTGKDGRPELWVRFFGHTSVADLPMREIREIQKFLPDYKGKNRRKDKRVAKRNKEVVDEYFRLKKSPRLTSYDRSEKGNSIANKIIAKIGKKYPELTSGLVKVVIAKNKNKEKHKEQI